MLMESPPILDPDLERALELILRRALPGIFYLGSLDKVPTENLLILSLTVRIGGDWEDGWDVTLAAEPGHSLRVTKVDPVT